MAKVNTKWFNKNEDFSMKTVGNNRQMERETSMGVTWTNYYLYGNKIATAVNNGGRITIELNTCGHETKTTRDAMKEFLSLYHPSFNVSFAKGHFTVLKKGEVVKSVPLNEVVERIFWIEV